MEKHEYQGDANNECAYRPHATARVCREAKDHAVHVLPPELKNAAEAVPRPIGEQLAASLAKAFPERFSVRGQEVQAIDLNPAVQAWDAFSAQVRDTIIRKSSGYGQAWQRQGWMGNLARIMSKSARLENMLWRDKPWLGTDGDESAEEAEAVTVTAVDLAALAAFFVANVEEDNRWGK